RLLGANVRRGENDLGPLVTRQGGKPPPSSLGLLFAEPRQRHVDVAHVDVDLVRSGLVGGITRDVSLALSVPDEPQPLRPILSTHVATNSSRGTLCQNHNELSDINGTHERSFQSNLRQLLPGGL